MKTRTDSTPLSVKAKSATRPEEESMLYEFEDETDTTLADPEPESHQRYTAEIEISEIEQEVQEPPVKRKMYQAKPPTRSQFLAKQDKPEVRTIEYTLINEESLQADTSKTEESQFIALHDDHVVSMNTDKFKRRSKTFGRYVTALLLEITDDETFFELQKNITNAIHDATKRQLVQRKS